MVENSVARVCPVNSVDGLRVREAIAGVRLQLLDQTLAREARKF
jgi:hypothetical protein